MATITIINSDAKEPDHTMKSLAVIFNAVVREREFQTDKYGPVTLLCPVSGLPMGQGPGGHELGTWSIILESELEEFKKALVHGGSKASKSRDTARAELIQIAAVAIAALEQHGVEEKSQPKTAVEGYAQRMVPKMHDLNITCPMSKAGDKCGDIRCIQNGMCQKTEMP